MQINQGVNSSRLDRYFANFDWTTIVYPVLIMLATTFAFVFYLDLLEFYNSAILLCTSVSTILLGHLWRSWRFFSTVVLSASGIGVLLYDGDLESSQNSFWLKYMLSSQSAILWSCFLFVLAMLIFWGGLFQKSRFLDSLGSAITWVATGMGFIGLLVRWQETYLISPEIGYIPVSNLYEVSILFCVITALLYQYYAQKMKTHRMGGVILPIISVCVAFILWYSISRDAQQIQPLVPALQSWWMKLHVPANFIGYGGFAVAAMLGIGDRLVAKGILKDRLPSQEVMAEVMYRSIAIGFLFFTIATILGAMWAAEAWGGYWSWDPKETWALIVWLNYATWLHVRLIKDWRGSILSWWAIIGLFVTTFAFMGVNIFLSGLHSYGAL